MLAGIIAGALGGGAQAVNQIADNQIQKQTRMELSKYESDLASDRAAAIARLQQTIGREDTLYNTTGDGGQAKLKFAKDEARGRADAEREGLAAYANDPNARRGVQLQARDKHVDGVGAVASAEASRYEVDRKRSIDKLLDEAADLEAKGDTEGAERKRRQADAKRGTTPGKTYADVVGAARVLEAQADALLDPSRGGDPTDPKKVADAQRLRQRAAEMAEGLAAKRGLGGAPEPAAQKTMPPPAAVQALKKDPTLKAQFEAKYGAGTADQFLK